MTDLTPKDLAGVRAWAETTKAPLWRMTMTGEEIRTSEGWIVALSKALVDEKARTDKAEKALKEALADRPHWGHGRYSDGFNAAVREIQAAVRKELL